ncbi:armadillo-type protein [Mycotypha africana]|uniref:armadillo-type protein n=1 Tax=Mycotypha africana TaxID=64632 RepID=UPI00230106DC|nr:armadillo-type protein [Mycotypha africana]KAI8984471.1 armadillo-type protein [Mycotypha africana]
MTGRRSPAIHYHRSYDKQIDVDWTTMVDRITKDTDQQASIFMQQKLKSGSSDQKPFIFQAILEQSFALMINRFGNFLVQRQFELGTPEQIALLADTMRGHILQLTCEPFGCHVVQKALDYVEESTKAELVSELLTSISETITHKYACHVWQKIFEINWSPSASPPPIMECLHEALQGQWARIALDETGSLVIQNIFENKSEKDKRPILNEVLDNIASIAKGQWGNWVIQHILEQAERDEDRERAFEIVIKEAVQLSTDQFASKVVEKALRIGGNQFLARFIKRITTNTSIKHDTVSHTTPSQHRIGIMDIASDQYGNYVAQWLINNASEEQKLHISRLIKRHMVSLRGTKYGQRVAFLVEKVLRNQEITTYPKSN